MCRILRKHRVPQNDASYRSASRVLLRCCTPAAADLEHHPVTEAPAPVPARAWVRFHEATIRPDREVIAWTDRAVQVRWTMRGGAVRTNRESASAVGPR